MVNKMKVIWGKTDLLGGRGIGIWKSGGGIQIYFWWWICVILKE
jgi:hypothetical protein